MTKPPPTKPPPPRRRSERQPEQERVAIEPDQIRNAPPAVWRFPQQPPADIAANARAFVEATIRRRRLSGAQRGAATRTINTASAYLSLYAPAVVARLSEIYAAAEAGRDRRADDRAAQSRRDAAQARRACAAASIEARAAADVADAAADLIRRATRPAADEAARAFVRALERAAPVDDLADARRAG